MTLLNLSIRDFRHIKELDVEFQPRTNLIQGPNAQGKTTILETVSYLSRGRSFRTARDRECIPWNAAPETFAAVQAAFDIAGINRTVRVAIEPAGKSIWLDARPLNTLSELLGEFQTVVFTPADLLILQGPPAGRRALMDSLITRVAPASVRHFAETTRALQQRNALLRKQAHHSNPEFDAFENTLAQHAARVISLRAELCIELSELASPPLRAISEETETLRIQWESGWRGDAAITPQEVIQTPHETLADRLRDLWSEQRRNDLDKGVTQSGPHRDDMAVTINDTDVRTWASQGQTRCCALALRLAETDLLIRKSNTPPLLLMDDILGDLDKTRAARFLQLLAERSLQSITTATDATLLHEHLHIDNRFTLENGILRET